MIRLIAYNILQFIDQDVESEIITMKHPVPTF